MAFRSVPPRYPTAADRDAGVAALSAAIAAGETAARGMAFDFEENVCSCVKVAQALGWNGSVEHQSPAGVDVYKFLRWRGFDSGEIARGNDKGGGFAGGRDALLAMEV